MSISEMFGWAAAALTLLTFASRDMRIARIVALTANTCFITYALTGGPMHVLALHLALVPINLRRLYELRRRDAGAKGEVAALQPGAASH